MLSRICKRSIITLGQKCPFIVVFKLTDFCLNNEFGKKLLKLMTVTIKAKDTGRKFSGLDVFHGSFTGNEILLPNANSYATFYR